MKRDPEIRAALLARLRTDPARWVCEHAPLCAAAIPDVVSCDDELHAWEIKSGADSLARLAPPHGFQMAEYGRVFDRVTLVCAPRHLARARDLVPAWWGIVLAADAGALVELIEHRPALANPQLNARYVAWVLHTTDLRPLAKRLGIRATGKPALVAAVAGRLSLDELRAEVRAAVKRRDYEPRRVEMRAIRARRKARERAGVEW